MAWQVDASWRQVVPSWAAEAAFSCCGNYRWWLRRRWAKNQRKLLFIGLNPSTASAIKSDATLRRLVGFSRSWGYGQLLVLNLFARISTSPAALKCCDDPIGSVNDDHLNLWGRQWSVSSQWDLWLGWGNRGAWQQRDLAVMAMLDGYCRFRRLNIPEARGPLALGLTSGGQPKHPLYISGQEVLRPFP